MVNSSSVQVEIFGKYKQALMFMVGAFVLISTKNLLLLQLIMVESFYGFARAMIKINANKCKSA